MSHIITKPKVDIDPDLLAEIKTAIHEVGQVIIHCLFKDSLGGSAIRIWQTTYLHDHASSHTSDLVHAERISYFPKWTRTRLGDNFFTLIFSGLPDGCTMFDLMEECNGGNGAFEVFNISRNSNDVYYIQFS